MLNAPPPKFTLAPVAGPANVTVIPLAGLPLASFTVATTGFENAALLTAVCGAPLVAVIEAGGPAVFVSEKLAEVPAPDALAVAV